VLPPSPLTLSPNDGYQLTVTFPFDMKVEAALFNPANYTLVANLGVGANTVSIATGTPAPGGGYLSVILTHSGTTLGGDYTLNVAGVNDQAGNPVTGTGNFLALEDDKINILLEPSGTEILLSFTTGLGAAQNLLNLPGVEDPTSYAITPADYPITPTVDAAQHPVSGELSVVRLTLTGMTSTTYSLDVGNAEAIPYDASVLPSESGQFTGTELGVGNSMVGAIGLSMSKAAGSIYGWLLADSSGKIVPNAVYRADFALNFTAMSVAPPVSNATFATVSVSNGAIQIDCECADVGGSKVIRVLSGLYTGVINYNWTSTPFTLTVIRNRRADFYTVLVNGVPRLTFPFALATGAATYVAGAAVVLAAPFTVGQFTLSSVNITASNTIFTNKWNFIHGLVETFVGSGVAARDRIYTKYGPLVKSWGDTTPATKNDVQVRINGIPIAISGVNPYEGEIYPAVPIPLTPIGTNTIEIDYQWFATPAFPLAGLNTRGLNLNAWSQAKGHTYGGLNPLPNSSPGVMPRRRFPLGVVLPPMRRKSPVRVGHRYYGWQRAYSALLNQYTTLRLNQNPRAFSDGNLIARGEPTVANYEGDVLPVSADPPWTLDGLDTGGVIGDGRYRVVSESGTGVVYYQEADLSRTASVQFAARLTVLSYTADGVFTGVAFGAHNNRSLVLIGFLVVSGVRSLGVLRDPSRPDLEESWDFGLGRTATGLSQTEITFSSTDFPRGVRSGDLLRILGPQAGVYEVAACGLSEIGGTVTVTLTTALPVDITTFGANTFTVLFDMPWDEDETTFRMVATFPTGALAVYAGGRISGLALSLPNVSSVGYTAQTGLLLPTREAGVVFWGATDRPATNTSSWNFVRFTSTPAPTLSTVTGITNTADMTVPPDQTANPWFIVEDFGQGTVDSSGTRLVLKSNCADDTENLVFGYGRLEPYLSFKGVVTDFTASFRIENGNLGAGNASLRIYDGLREARVTTIRYVEYAGVRRLFDLGSVSISGLRNPVLEGWTPSTGNNLADPVVRVHALETNKSSLTTGRWAATVPPPTPSFIIPSGGVLEARIQVLSFTPDSGALVAPVWSATVPTAAPGSAREVQVQLTPTGVALADRTGFVIVAFPFAWDDGEYHTYRTVINVVTNSVVLVVDDVVIGSTPFAGFPLIASTAGLLADFGFIGSGTAQVLWDAVSCTPFTTASIPGAVFNRTFGVPLAGLDHTSIDGYRIPRSDNTNAPNSSLSAAPVSMNWSVYCKVRMRLDPAWGLSIYRPDLPPPPGFVSPEFLSETTDPNGAWINVEYRQLPLHRVTYPEVPSLAFGALDKRGITQQRWQDVSYRLRGTPNGSYLAPKGMVLNRAIPQVSGEYTLDKTPEVRAIPARTMTQVYLWDANLHAARVFFVQVGSTVLAGTDWSFDFDNQTVTLVSAVAIGTLVTVTFTVGKPLTATYLCSQPINETVTVLNEGTPPVPKNNYDLPETRVVSTDPLDPTESSVTFTAGPEARYVDLNFCEVTDGESVPLSIACDGPAPGMGLAEIALSGSLFFDTEAAAIPGGPGGAFGHSSPSVSGSATHFYPGAMMVLGGGRPTSPNTYNVLNTAILQTNLPGTEGMGLNQDVRFVLTTTIPYSDALAAVASDNTPPTDATPNLALNPDGMPNPSGNGACVAQLTDYVFTGVSRLGPWGGLASLSTNSLLAGGSQITGTAFTLVGGSPLPPGTTVVTNITIYAP
jgi:hypothetical protein